MIKMDLKEAQLKMLDILNAFDAICKENSLTYWLDHGTLLGAVREGGFIPWDDDLDVSMPREDYERFLKIAPNILPKNLFLQTKRSDPKVPIHYAKLRERGTLYVDTWEVGKKIRYHQGIFIDIFPVNRIDKKRLKAYRRWMQVAKLFSNRYLRIDFLAKPLMTLLNGYHKQDGEYLVSGAETMAWITHIEASKVFPLANIDFEGMVYPSPKNKEAYLQEIFGANYITPPPQEKRIAHSSAIYRLDTEGVNAYE